MNKTELMLRGYLLVVEKELGGEDKGKLAHAVYVDGELLGLGVKIVYVEKENTIETLKDFNGSWETIYITKLVD